MGQLPSVEYVPAESVSKIIDDLKNAGVILSHIRGSIHDDPFGQEWDCRWRHVHRWMSFVVDRQAPGHLFVCLGHEPWHWWFLHRSENRQIDDVIDAAVQRYAIQPPSGKSGFRT